MLECYEIENIEQLRAIADVLRMHIIDILLQRPMTVTQLGDVLGEPPAKIHYHVRELKKAGLLRLVETREKGGILEKYYQPIARNFSAEKMLFSAPPDEALATTNSWLSQMKDGFQRAFRRALEQKDEQPRMSIVLTSMYLTAEEQEQLSRQIAELTRSYEQPRGVEGEKEVLATWLVFPQVAASDLSTNRPNLSESASTAQNSWTVGVVDFSRADMEKALLEGKRLRINVTGLCRIADDVSADLADRAIERFQLIGKLLAPPPVYEVLTRKRSA